MTIFGLINQIRKPRKIFDAEGFGAAHGIDVCLELQFFAVGDQQLK